MEAEQSRAKLPDCAVQSARRKLLCGFTLAAIAILQPRTLVVAENHLQRTPARTLGKQFAHESHDVSSLKRRGPKPSYKLSYVAVFQAARSIWCPSFSIAFSAAETRKAARSAREAEAAAPIEASSALADVSSACARRRFRVLVFIYQSSPHGRSGYAPRPYFLIPSKLGWRVTPRVQPILSNRARMSVALSTAGLVSKYSIVDVSSYAN